MLEQQESLIATAGLDASQQILSFFPIEGESRYPHIPAGFYIFVQDKNTTEIFLLKTASGHGHPFAGNLVNKMLNRPNNDFSWVKPAGEIVFSVNHEILGHSFRTGFFHESLELTEPELTDIPAFTAYLQRINDVLKKTHLPRERFFGVREWEGIVFTQENRRIFFEDSGSFRNMKPEEMIELYRNFRARLLTERINHLFEGLFKGLMHNPNNSRKASSYYGSCASTLFQPAAQSTEPFASELNHLTALTCKVGG
jgi:hypothetical protein